MPIIHYLNVKDGDCIGIEHISGNKTVIDVCNATVVNYLSELLSAYESKSETGLNGNFNQKKYPINPISYFKEKGWVSVFRFILTHPDMDHMDGVQSFFEAFEPINFWDTDNKKEMSKNNWEGSPYSEADWNFYKKIRDNKPSSNPKRLTLYSGDRNKYFNKSEDGTNGGDGLHILAPTKELVNSANETAGDYHSCSYVILYNTSNHKIVFAGDSHNATWEHILSNHKNDVRNIDILIAPHHGRKSDRSYEFLDILNPKITFFGNANSEHLAYNAWNYRELAFITNNQAGCIIADVGTGPIKLYVTNEVFAKAINPHTYYSDVYRAFYLLEF
jgi:beta-lactamase superfamily II metal-dependent hydrolase